MVGERDRDWADKLNKTEKAHLFNSGVLTKKQFLNTRKHQLDTIKKYPDGTEPCWECRSIAYKLGLE